MIFVNSMKDMQFKGLTLKVSSWLTLIFLVTQISLKYLYHKRLRETLEG